MDTSLDGGASTGTVDALAQRLRRPAGSLQGCAQLSADELAMLVRALDAAIAQRRSALDQALCRFLPWPLRAPILRWLRR